MLLQIIIEKIQKKGPISFENFMDMALYYPNMGYYANPDIVIGKEGDFYTSPHLHPIFGAMICRQLIEMWELMGRPSEFHAVEMGAGTGHLCSDILDYLNRTEKDREFARALHYIIVEPYRHFEHTQRQVLKEHGSRIVWISNIDDLHNVKGCFLSNELLDAFPVHVIQMDEGLKELYVNAGEHGLKEELTAEVSKEIEIYADQFSIPFQEGYRTEINLRIKSWLKQVNTLLDQGFILTVDYGYSAREFYSEERNRGTLLCYHRHQVNEKPFEHIGLQDMTSHVNFSSLKQWGEDLGIETIGYSAQGIYLTALGIDELIVELYGDSPDYIKELSKIKGLILPQGMGESHRVMIQYKGKGSHAVRGYSFKNEMEHL